MQTPTYPLPDPNARSQLRSAWTGKPGFRACEDHAGRFQVVIATRGLGHAVGGLIGEVAVQGVKIAPEVRREVLRLRGILLVNSCS
jgi:hypothetical protein